MKAGGLAQNQEDSVRKESCFVRVKEFVIRCYRRVADFVIRQCKRLSEWYMARQEVLRIRSEASYERITVTRAVLIFLETCGLGSRNIFYTMWHLIWRPGYMMSDYLNGHRKSYSQPILMFFVLTLILVQLAYVMKVPMVKNMDMTLTAFNFMRGHDTISVERRDAILTTAEWLDAIHDWRDENKSWDIMIHSLGIMVVSWLLWRKSPRVGSAEWIAKTGKKPEGYNFAEIVTVILYILCQLQIISIVVLLLFRTLPFDHNKLGLLSLVQVLSLYTIFFVDFKQLFQRDWWATAWRTAIIVVFI